MKKAFVTGGTGFLGLNLIEDLMAENWEVYALHRKNSDLTYLKRFNVNLVEGTITDIASLQKAMPENLDAVFHVAGDTSLWKKLNEVQYQNNVIGTRNMLTVALEKKATRFIHTSSISAHGSQKGIVNEDTPSTAENSFINYDKTKYLAEKEVDKAVEKGLNAVILNPCHIVGKYDKHNWAQLIQMTYRDKLPGIPPGSGMYCHAKDISHAHINAVEKGNIGERHLLGGVEANFLESINIVQKILGREPYKKSTPPAALKLVMWMGMLGAAFNSKEPTVTPEKFAILTKKSVCDYSKAIKVLDYQTSSLEKMIGDCFYWLKEENLL